MSQIQEKYSCCGIGNQESRVFQGQSVAKGIAIGKICVYRADGEGAIPHFSISSEAVTREQERARRAIEAARNTMRAMVERAESTLAPHLAEIFQMHYALLEDRWILESIDSEIADSLVNAEHAVVDVFQSFVDDYSTKMGHFADFAQDLKDIRDRILESFGHQVKVGFECQEGVNSPVIIAAESLVPSLVLNVCPENVMAFVSMEGGVTTHATILARSLGVPIIFGIPVSRDLHCGDMAIVDGYQGSLLLNPDQETLETYREKALNLERMRIRCESLAMEPVKAPSGRNINLKINLSFPEELDMAGDVLHQGIGLLRTEFMMFHRDAPPSEEDMAAQLRRILDLVGPDSSITVRALDISSDKLPPYMSLPAQKNPDLGIRGARALEYFPEIYNAQFRAFWRVNEPGRFRVLFPMVSDLADLKVFQQALERAARELRSQGISFKEPMTQGIMIETPSAALTASSLMNHVDFVNIGSNDLSQYTLASTRGDAATEERYHIFHPSLASLIQMVAKAGADKGREVCLCGEISYFEEFYPLILALGIESVSISISKLRDIKCFLHGLESMTPADYQDVLDRFGMLSLKAELDTFFSSFSVHA